MKTKSRAATGLAILAVLFGGSLTTWGKQWLAVDWSRPCFVYAGIFLLAALWALYQREADLDDSREVMVRFPGSPAVKITGDGTFETVTDVAIRNKGVHETRVAFPSVRVFSKRISKAKELPVTLTTERAKTKTPAEVKIWFRNNPMFLHSRQEITYELQISFQSKESDREIIRSGGALMELTFDAMGDTEKLVEVVKLPPIVA